MVILAVVSLAAWLTSIFALLCFLSIEGTRFRPRLWVVFGIVFLICLDLFGGFFSLAYFASA